MRTNPIIVIPSMHGVITGVISKKSLLYAISLLLLFTIFCAFHISSNTAPFSLSREIYSNGVAQGCYWLYTASDQTPLDKEKREERNCSKHFPDVIVMGAKKCGTTALRNFLTFHPQIATSKGEVHFFDNRYYLGMDWYLDQMPYSTPEQITLEKTPKYFVHPLSPRAIRKHLGPNVKFILILRDPIKRAVSDFVHVVTSKALQKPQALPLESSLTEEQKAVMQYVKKLSNRFTLPAKEGDTFEESVLYPNGSVNTRTSIVDTGIYVKHLKKWLEVFPSEQFLVLDGEEFVYNPLPTLQRVEEFLSLQKYFSHDTFYFDLEKSFFCLSRPIRSCMKPAKGRPHPYVSQDAMRTLRKFYYPYNLELVRIMKLNFSWLPSI